jgi:hypothetical protein
MVDLHEHRLGGGGEDSTPLNAERVGLHDHEDEKYNEDYSKADEDFDKHRFLMVELR